MIRTAKTLNPFTGKWYVYETQRDAEGVTWFSFDSWRTSSRSRDRAYKKASIGAKQRCTGERLACQEAAA